MDESSEFIRERRYLTQKIADVEAALDEDEKWVFYDILEKIQNYREANGKSPEVRGVLIRDTMACYEDAWRLLEQEVTNQ